ncbi:hypothetical protein M413DRAFT_19048 [Hebeloma cylindrosporum]|uniref:Nickel/cobalt efflux system n=1 Tax=Hebeloma cylindrosporum TaxID=76867 RepID=A0A0C2YIG4_HEBCY|nr:hypothetical protein M413DRAFT_19048 [Hebeloma cylindrosporum h7]
MALPKLTLFGRSVLLLFSELAANAICWTVAGILFGRNSETRPTLSLALLAWDESAIDNATRGLLNLGQLPVTCGLFFSLGHSTIVVVVTVAIAISSDIYHRLDGVGEIGGIVGAAVSGTFLFIIGLANSIILWKIMKGRRENKILKQRQANGEADVKSAEHHPEENHMLMMRLLGPIITFVNRPWKMYPVGVLFGLGFDTASSIALLAISAIAKKGPDGSSIPSSHVVILPLLFTAGMTLVDSVDSILMLYSYSGFPERSFIMFSPKPECDTPVTCLPPVSTDDPSTKEKGDLEANIPEAIPHEEKNEQLNALPPEDPNGQLARNTRVKMNVMSGLSIILTLMSILVAFSISLITIMGLIGEQCKPCREAADATDGGGLAGRWWRGWRNVSSFVLM